MVYCTSCSSENNDGTKFCTKCGAPLASAASGGSSGGLDNAPSSSTGQGDSGPLGAETIYSPPSSSATSSGSSSGGASYDPYAAPNNPYGSDPYGAPSSATSGSAYGDQAYGSGGSPYPMQQAGYGGGGLFSIGEKRDPILVLVLTLVTCGIYGIYWWNVSITEIKNSLGREDINPAMELLLGFVTCGIYFIYLYYKYPQLLLEMQDRVRLPRNDISLISILLTVFGLGLVSIFMIQTEMNKIWDAAGAR
jgi:hypothetical protein